MAAAGHAVAAAAAHDMALTRDDLPGWKSVTFEPAATTSPTNSCPITIGTGIVRLAQASQLRMCRSVPQMPALSTRINTSLIPNSGSGTSASHNPGSARSLTNAFIAPQFEASSLGRYAYRDHHRSASKSTIGQCLPFPTNEPRSTCSARSSRSERSTRSSSRSSTSSRPGGCAIRRCFPGERRLATAMGVSRHTIREAIEILQDAGVLAVEPGGSGGTRVASIWMPESLVGD